MYSVFCYFVIFLLGSVGCQTPKKLNAKELDAKFYHDISNGDIPAFFRYLTVDTQSGYLFVGAMNAIHALNLQNIETTHRRFKHAFNSPPQSIYQCKMQGLKEFPDCQNNVRILIRNISVPNTFFMCSTGAHSPTIYHLRLMPGKFQVISENLNEGSGICPFDPADNTTAILVENGNTGLLPAIYAAGVSDFMKTDPLIMRPNLYYPNNTLAFRFVRSLKDRFEWLNEPQFVGSFDLGKHVYFFFREVALEHTNCGKKIYSRVARICKSDNGGRDALRSVWLTFVKARLNCSIAGEYPFYFDEIQDVFLVGETFYGLFSTNVNGVTASAICAYTLSSLNRAFSGTFKAQEHSRTNWLPIPNNDLPNPHPGSCSISEIEKLSDSHVNFISRSILLMDKPVVHQHSQPLFYQTNCLLQKLAVINNISGHGDISFLAASNEGLVYKVFIWPSRHPQRVPPKSYVSMTYAPFEKVTPIVAMIMQGQSLFLSSDQSVVQFSTVMCEAYRHVDLCIFDAYCGWDAEINSCVHSTGTRSSTAPSYVTDILQKKHSHPRNTRSSSYTIPLPNRPAYSKATLGDRSFSFASSSVWNSSKYVRVITFIDVDLENYSLEKAMQLRIGDLYSFDKVTKNSGSLIMLKINYKLSTEGTVSWRKDGSLATDSRHILAQDNSLVITDLTKADEGVYEALDDQKRTVAKYHLSIETAKEQIEQRWMKKFDQWCDEFETYQRDIRQWEKKCNACCEDLPMSNLVPRNG